MADTISNFLTSVRNASSARLETTSTPHSKLLLSLAHLLRDEGYIRAVRETVNERGHRRIEMTLKYVDETPAITDIQRVSRPGRRVYHKSTEIPRVLGGLGFSILTTSRGILKDRDARRQKLGGEVICKVW